MATSLAILDDNDPLVHYVGTWAQNGAAQEFSGTTHCTAQTGATASISFIGTAVSVYGTVSAGLRDATLSFVIDNSVQGTYTSPTLGGTLHHELLYASPTLPKSQAAGTDPDAHTLVITQTASAAQCVVFLDYFTFATTPASGAQALLVDDRDSAVVYQPVAQQSEADGFMMRTSSSISRAGSSLRLDFDGRGISFFGGPNSRAVNASIVVDNGPATIFSSAGNLNSLIYNSGDLADGKHTLVVTTQNDNALAVDYFLVVPPAAGAVPPGGGTSESASASASASSASASDATSASTPSDTATPASDTTITSTGTSTVSQTSAGSGSGTAVAAVNNNSSSAPSAGPIVGGVVGGIVVLAVLCFGIVFFMRKRAQRRRADAYFDAQFDPDKVTRRSQYIDGDGPDDDPGYSQYPPVPVPVPASGRGTPQAQAQAYSYAGGYGQHSPYTSPDQSAYGAYPTGNAYPPTNAYYPPANAGPGGGGAYPFASGAGAGAGTAYPYQQPYAAGAPSPSPAPRPHSTAGSAGFAGIGAAALGLHPDPEDDAPPMARELASEARYAGGTSRAEEDSGGGEAPAPRYSGSGY
ncbi:hypothetical protein MKEN_00157800 [Mycena kentingensis (nom. inval.)]|nr:hypothetical protein MKEN_00157800 [Mycena kentingensis (nom. inval.)]